MVQDAKKTMNPLDQFYIRFVTTFWSEPKRQNAKWLLKLR
jgi:hypothetical protein